VNEQGTLRDRVIVVTGAGRGQGAAEATALRKAGAHVIACDVAWPDGGPYRTLDVTDARAWDDLAADLKERFGVVHGLVNNAGTSMRTRLGEVTLEDWNRTMAVNCTGPMLGMQALMPLMPPGASIVNIGSLAALTAHPSTAYTASKWALRGLSRVASLQLGERGIRVNLINPGYIETAMTASAPGGFRDANIRNAPLARTGTVADLVPLVLFLLSEQSSFITGAEIAVDGGQSAHAGAMAMLNAERPVEAG
jgi:3alpha(or 20beta)-hydroxysteroid dehydrogenase